MSAWRGALDIDMHLQYQLMVVATIAGVVAPVAFALYYTWICDWWRNPTGRSIMALDACILLLRFPRSIELLHDPSNQVFGPIDWVMTGAALLLPLVILYRMAAFERIRRHEKRKRESEAAVRALLTMHSHPRYPGPRTDPPEAA